MKPSAKTDTSQKQEDKADANQKEGKKMIKSPVSKRIRKAGIHRNRIKANRPKIIRKA